MIKVQKQGNDLIHSFLIFFHIHACTQARACHALEGRQAGTLAPSVLSTKLSMKSLKNYLPDKPKMCNVPSLDKMCTISWW